MRKTELITSFTELQYGHTTFYLVPETVRDVPASPGVRYSQKKRFIVGQEGLEEALQRREPGTGTITFSRCYDICSALSPSHYTHPFWNQTLR